MTKQTMTKRFYKTASAFQHPQILMTLGEAIEHATQYINDEKGEEYYIVEVIRIVRKEKSPIEVIEIRK